MPIVAHLGGLARILGLLMEDIRKQEASTWSVLYLTHTTHFGIDINRSTPEGPGQHCRLPYGRGKKGISQHVTWFTFVWCTSRCGCHLMVLANILCFLVEEVSKQPATTWPAMFD